MEQSSRPIQVQLMTCLSALVAACVIFAANGCTQAHGILSYWGWPEPIWYAKHHTDKTAGVIYEGPLGESLVRWGAVNWIGLLVNGLVGCGIVLLVAAICEISLRIWRTRPSMSP